MVRNKNMDPIMDVSNYPETLFLISEKILKEEFVKDSNNINHMVKGIVLTNHTLRNFSSLKNFVYVLSHQHQFVKELLSPR